MTKTAENLIDYPTKEDEEWMNAPLGRHPQLQEDEVEQNNPGPGG